MSITISINGKHFLIHPKNHGEAKLLADLNQEIEALKLQSQPSDLQAELQHQIEENTKLRINLMYLKNQNADFYFKLAKIGGVKDENDLRNGAVAELTAALPTGTGTQQDALSAALNEAVIAVIPADVATPSEIKSVVNEAVAEVFQPESLKKIINEVVQENAHQLQNDFAVASE